MATPGLSCLIFFRASHVTCAEDASDASDSSIPAPSAGARACRMASAEKDQARRGHFLDPLFRAVGVACTELFHTEFRLIPSFFMQWLRERIREGRQREGCVYLCAAGARAAGTTWEWVPLFCTRYFY